METNYIYVDKDKESLVPEVVTLMLKLGYELGIKDEGCGVVVYLASHELGENVVITGDDEKVYSEDELDNIIKDAIQFQAESEGED